MQAATSDIGVWLSRRNLRQIWRIFGLSLGQHEPAGRHGETGSLSRRSAAQSLAFFSMGCSRHDARMGSLVAL